MVKIPEDWLSELEETLTLEDKCYECRGSGRDYYSHERCDACNGSGYTTTALGDKVLALLRHNFQSFLQDARQA